MPERDPGELFPALQIRNLRLKVGLLAALTVFLVAGFVLFVLYSRGAFEPTQRLVLITNNADGFSVGMDLTFRGFPIGRVTGIRLAEDGSVRVRIDVPKSEAKWLRSSSKFVLERMPVGAAKLRATSHDLSHPPLEDRAEMPVLRGDAVEILPEMIANLRNIVSNVERMTTAASNLNASIASLQVVTDRMAGKHGALEAALGSADNAAKVLAAIDRTNALIASLQGVSKKVDSTVGRIDSAVGRADQRVLGQGGMLDQAQQAGVQLNAMLVDARESLKKADAVLANAQVASTNVKAATADLAVLRAEVDASLRKIGGLIDEVNRKWPFERNTEIKLP